MKGHSPRCQSGWWERLYSIWMLMSASLSHSAHCFCKTVNDFINLCSQLTSLRQNILDRRFARFTSGLVSYKKEWQKHWPLLHEKRERSTDELENSPCQLSHKMTCLLNGGLFFAGICLKVNLCERTFLRIPKLRSVVFWVHTTHTWQRDR